MSVNPKLWIQRHDLEVDTWTNKSYLQMIKENCRFLKFQFQYTFKEDLIIQDLYHSRNGLQFLQLFICTSCGRSSPMCTALWSTSQEQFWSKKQIANCWGWIFFYDFHHPVLPSCWSWLDCTTLAAVLFILHKLQKVRSYVYRAVKHKPRATTINQLQE